MRRKPRGCGSKDGCAIQRRRGYADSLRRGVQLARADYVHAIGSLATLAITIFLTGLVVFFAIREGSGQALRIAAVLALLVLAPVFVLGAAVLYVNGGSVAAANLGTFIPQTSYDLFLGSRPASAPS